MTIFHLSPPLLGVELPKEILIDGDIIPVVSLSVDGCRLNLDCSDCDDLARLKHILGELLDCVVTDQPNTPQVKKQQEVKLPEPAPLTFARETPIQLPSSDPCPVSEEDEESLINEIFDNLGSFITEQTDAEETVQEDQQLTGGLHGSIWQSIFRKPKPVEKIVEWISSPHYTNFVYLPNDLSKGPSCEAGLSNGYYTQTLLAGYQAMCRSLGINPIIKMASGEEIPALSLSPLDSVQQHVKGETGARFCTSELAGGFNDLGYKEDFMKALQGLPADDYENEQIWMTVLSKAESILFGETNLVTNAMVAARLLGLMEFATIDPESSLYNKHSIISTVISIVNAMKEDGAVLQTAKPKFLARIAASGMSQYRIILGEFYSEACAVKGSK